MKCSNFAPLVLFAFCLSGKAYGVDADCYDKGDKYFIPAANLLEAKKKALLCFFAEITVKSSTKEDNREVEFTQELNLEAKSSVIDWQGLRRTESRNLYQWAIKDVNENLKQLAHANEKKVIPVEKEVQEVWRSNAIKKEVIEISSKPQGASVTFDGVENACVTPCKLEVLDGSHAIGLWKQDYTRLSGTVSVDSHHDSFAFELKENIGRIAFTDCPAATSINIDGNRYGNTSDSVMKLAPGNYVLEFEHPEYFKNTQKISVRVGDNSKVTCAMKPKIGGIEISARSSKGEPVKASVEIDGTIVGKTPGTYEVRAGSRRVKISTSDEAWEDTIIVQKSSTSPIVAKLTPIESEEEKNKRNSYRSFSTMIEIGSMNGLKFIEKSSGTEYKFEDCRENGDPSKGDTGRFILGKNLSDNFGINIGYLSGRYEVCHMYYEPKTYEALRSRYDVEFKGATLGLNYSLYTQWNQVQNPSDRSFTRWFDFRLSYMPHLGISLQKDKTQGKSRYALPGALLGEFSLATWTFDMVKISMINVGYLGQFKLPEDSAVELGDFSVLSYFGFGLSF